ncbi:hypothetical protein, partial [Kitasatospora cheerisanensis]|uniref:hypothetical protein n=1 Tax=Kitasatospora cheerisanensis TaxID=81942 RepID=UPI001AD81D30
MPTLAALAARARAVLGTGPDLIRLIEADAIRSAARLARAEPRPAGLSRVEAAAWRLARDQIAAALEAES